MSTPAKAPPLSDEDIAEIKAAAEKATKDEWFVVKSPWLPRGVETYVVAGSPDPHAALMICDFQDAVGAGVESDWEDADWTERNWANAEHIAASNPIAVLGLIDRIQSLTTELERCREALSFYAAEGSWQDDIAPDPAGTMIPYTSPAHGDRGQRAIEALAIGGQHAA